MMGQLSPLSPSTHSSPDLSRHVSMIDITNSLYSQSSSSQIAWLAGLNPHFDSPTGDQKFLRKVSRPWLAAVQPSF